MQAWIWLGKVVFQHATVILVAHLMMASVSRTPMVIWCLVAVTAKRMLRAVDATPARMASGTLMKTIQRVASVRIYRTSYLPVYVKQFIFFLLLTINFSSLKLVILIYPNMQGRIFYSCSPMRWEIRGGRGQELKGQKILLGNFCVILFMYEFWRYEFGNILCPFSFLCWVGRTKIAFPYTTNRTKKHSSHTVKVQVNPTSSKTENIFFINNLLFGVEWRNGCPSW